VPIKYVLDMEGGGGETGDVPKPYTNKVMSYERAIEKKGRIGRHREKAHLPEDAYWHNLRWVTAVDFWFFMDKHKHILGDQIPMFSKETVLAQLRKLASLKRQQGALTGLSNNHNLVIINTGEHWMLAQVLFDTANITLMDPYDQQKELRSVEEIKGILESAAWKVSVRRLACQRPEDMNSCGYHVLQWIWQISKIHAFRAEVWQPEYYNKKDRIGQQKS